MDPDAAAAAILAGTYLEKTEGEGTLSGTRIRDYLVSEFISKRPVHGCIAAMSFTATCTQAVSVGSTARPYTLTMLYNEDNPMSLGMGEDFAAEYSLACGTTVPDHPCVVKAVHSFIDSACSTQLPGVDSWRSWDRAFFVVTERHGIPLSAVLEQRRAKGLSAPFFREHEAMVVALRIATALLHLQQHGVVHRGVSLDTIWVDDSGGSFSSKLSGFGAAFNSRTLYSTTPFTLPLSSKHTVRGGPCLPPEIARAEPGRGVTLDYTKCDAFGLGVVLHNMLSTHAFPFSDCDGDTRHITSERYIPLPEGYHPALRRLVQGLTSPHLSQRLGLAEALQHLVVMLSETYAKSVVLSLSLADSAQRAIDAEARAAEAEADRAEQLAEKKQVADQLSALQWDMGEMECKMKEAEEALSSLGAAQEAIELLEQRLGEKAEEVAFLQQQVAERDEAIAAARGERDEAVRKVALLESQLASLREEVSSHPARNDAPQQQTMRAAKGVVLKHPASDTDSDSDSDFPHRGQSPKGALDAKPPDDPQPVEQRGPPPSQRPPPSPATSSSDSEFMPARRPAPTPPAQDRPRGLSRFDGLQAPQESVEETASEASDHAGKGPLGAADEGSVGSESDAPQRELAPDAAAKGDGEEEGGADEEPVRGPEGSSDSSDSDFTPAPRPTASPQDEDRPRGLSRFGGAEKRTSVQTTPWGDTTEAPAAQPQRSMFADSTDSEADAMPAQKPPPKAPPQKVARSVLSEQSTDSEPTLPAKPSPKRTRGTSLFPQSDDSSDSDSPAIPQKPAPKRSNAPARLADSSSSSSGSSKRRAPPAARQPPPQGRRPPPSSSKLFADSSDSDSVEPVRKPAPKPAAKPTEKPRTRSMFESSSSSEGEAPPKRAPLPKREQATRTTALFDDSDSD
eukprot:Sspe_Gene.24127::Locus_9488_Transcript_1_1_Confidence_1.000_Length_2812::g.24127::m.24127